MAEDLKPCPLCGSHAIIAGFWRHIIRCSNCSCQSAPFSSLSDAVNSWNSRALTPAQEHSNELYEALGYVLTQLKLAFMGFSNPMIDANRLQALYNSISEEQDEQQTHRQEV